MADEEGVGTAPRFNIVGRLREPELAEEFAEPEVADTDLVPLVE